MISIFITPLKQFYRTLLRKFYTFRVQIQAQEVKGKIVVNGKSYVSDTTRLGNNVHFNGIRIDGKGMVIIGDNFHSGYDCLLITSYHNYDHGTKIPYDDTYIHKDIIIEDNVWLGSRVIILGGVTIGEGAIIQAGSVVVKSVAKYCIAGGSPAEVFKTRNIDHYNLLKNKNAFN